MPNLDLEKIYTYHPPKGDQPALYDAIREKTKALAKFVQDSCPDSRERAVALTHLETFAFWTNASIARNT